MEEVLEEFEKCFDSKVLEYEKVTSSTLRSCEELEKDLELFLSEQKEHFFLIEHKHTEDVNTNHFLIKKETLARRYKSLVKEKDDTKEELLLKILEFRNSQKQVEKLEKKKMEIGSVIKVMNHEIGLVNEKEVKEGEKSDIGLMENEIQRLKKQRNEISNLIEEENDEITNFEDKLRQIEEEKEISDSKKQIYYSALLKGYKKSFEMVEKQVNDCKKSLKEKNTFLEDLDHSDEEIKEQIKGSKELIQDSEEDIESYKSSFSEHMEDLKKIEHGEYLFKEVQKLPEDSKKKYEELVLLEETVNSSNKRIVEILQPNLEKYTNFCTNIERKVNEFDNIKKYLKKLVHKIKHKLEIYEASNLLDPSIQSMVSILTDHYKMSVDQLSSIRSLVSSTLSSSIDETNNMIRLLISLISDTKKDIIQKSTKISHLSKIVGKVISEKLGNDSKLQFSEERKKKFENKINIYEKINEIQDNLMDSYEQVAEERLELDDSKNRLQINKRSRNKILMIKNLLFKFEKKIQDIEKVHLSKMEELEKIINSEVEEEDGNEEEEINKKIQLNRLKIREEEQKLKYVSDKIRIISMKLVTSKTNKFLTQNPSEEDFEKRICQLKKDIESHEKEIELIDDEINKITEMQEDEDELDYERELTVEKEVDLFTLEAKIEEKNIPMIEIPQKLRPRIVIQEIENDESDNSRPESPQIILVIPSPSANRRVAGLMSPAPVTRGRDIFKT